MGHPVDVFDTGSFVIKLISVKHNLLCCRLMFRRCVYRIDRHTKVLCTRLLACASNSESCRFVFILYAWYSKILHCISVAFYDILLLYSVL